MDCEEDAHSLLSLSHSILPADNTSIPVSSSSQLHNWPGQDESGMAEGHFSPVSPPTGYSNSSHEINANPNSSSKFFSSRSSISHNHTKTNIIMGQSRPDNHPLQSMALTIQNPPSISHSTPPVTSSVSSDFVLNTANHGGHEQVNFYYDQTHSFQNTVSGYQNHHSVSLGNPGGDDFEHVGQHLEVNPADNPALSHSGYSGDHSVLELDRPQNQNIDAMTGIMARGSLANSHTSSGDIISVSPSLFDARHKQMNYSKEMPNVYESSTSKADLGLPMTPERRTVEDNTLVNDLEFSVSSRDLAAVNASTLNNDNGNSNNNQFDNSSLNRQVQDFDFRLDRAQDGNAYTMNQDQSALKLSEDTNSVNHRPTIWGYSGFQENTQQQHSEELNFNSNQKKIVSNEQRDSVPKQEDSGIQFQRLENQDKSVGSSERFSNITDESRPNNIQISQAFQSWSGRTRAHRKMARLLGQTNYNDKTTKLQHIDICTSTSRPISFPKIQPSISQVSFREAHKGQESPPKFHYSQGYQRDHVVNAQLVSDNDRDVRSIPYSLGQDQGGKRDIEVSKHHGGTSVRDFNLPVSFGLSTDGHSASVSKDQSSVLTSAHLLPPSHLDLDFQPTLSLESSHERVGQDDFFNNSIDNQHISQLSLAFPDSLNSQHSQELNFESYLNSSTDKDLELIRKYPEQVQRELATDNDFDFDEYIESSRLTQTYFERSSNLPQDMTVYQKSSQDKFGGSDSTSITSKDRDSCHSGKTITKQTGLSELQKELIKTSTKESLKGIRIPRDINRAMEILQDMQEDERAEERRKEEIQKHFQNEIHEQKEQHQQQQQQQQHQMIHQSIAINSSPKKVFQNKHQIENLSLADQQFLGESANFIEEQSVPTVNFLDQPPLMFSESQQQTNTEFCDPSLQDMPNYSSFPSSHSITEIDLSIMSKREQNEGYQNANSVLNNHLLKKMSTSTKDQEMNPSLSSFSMPAVLNSNLAAPSGHDLSCNMLGPSRFSDQPNIPAENVPNRPNLSANYSFIEQERIRHDLPYQCKDGDLDKSQNFQMFRNESTDGMPQEMHKSMGREADFIGCARESLYNMMKQEQLCDAVLSISQQNVKVHQVVLCSMSNYLRSLLLKSRPSSHKETLSTSYIPDPYGVALVINCEAMKSSSVTAFLMFIYLGKTDFTESNVVDLFILASSLHVFPLRDLCQKYMWRVHISEEQLKIPQVHVIDATPGKQNQACQVNLKGTTETEDKCINTGSVVKSMPAATQTDTSRPGVGGGGQEEWVMLKKTKQKTVSPSKMKYACAAKSTSLADTSLVCRHGKKGWLSPKRRFKTEQHLAQAKFDITEQNTLQAKHKDSTDMNTMNNDGPCQTTSEINHLTLSKPPSEFTNHSSPSHQHSTQILPEADYDTNTKANVQQLNANKTEQSEHSGQGGGTQLPLKVQKTTVEIAEEAAAAKSAAHNYGTRLSGRGCHKQSISYSALVHAYDKKKSTSGSRERPSLMKNKDFVKNHSSADNDSSKSSSKISSSLSTNVEKIKEKVITNMPRNSCELSSVNNDALSLRGPLPPPLQTNSEIYKSRKSVVGKPLKKNIAQRAQDSEMASDASVQAQSTFSHNSVITDVNNGGVGTINVETSTIPQTSTNVTSSNNSNIAIVSDGDLTNVSSIIDSLVNTLESEVRDTDLQIVLGDLDSELSNTLLPATIQTPSSTMTPVSIFNPTKEPSLSPVHPQLPSSSLSSSASPLSPSPEKGTSEAVASQKSKATPQGYRKRLIQLMKSESVKISSAPDKCTEDLSVTETIESQWGGEQNKQNDQHLKSTSEYISFASNSSAFHSDENKNGSCNEQISQDEKEIGHSSPGNDLMSLTNQNAEEDLTLCAKYDEETQFHKIFKRRRKAKFRKSLGIEAETSNVKMRLKKGQGSDQEGGSTVKGCHRRNTANDSDSGSSRPKARKMASNDAVSSVLKVRPPPKKRAKMELELMNVANKKSELPIQGDRDKDKDKDEENESVVKDENKNNEKAHPGLETLTKSAQSEEQKCGKDENKSDKAKEMLKTNEGQSEREREKNMGGKPRKLTTSMNIKTTNDDSDGSPKPTVEKKSKREDTKEIRQCVQILDERLRSSNVVTQFFSCKFCQAQLKSAQRTIKHVMSFHEITGPEVLDYIAIGDEGKTNETCDICGYVTKDTTYKYMHYHKYFKHNIPLPKGWSLCKCHICDKEFHTNFHLREHIQSHSDNFFFVCWYCGQNFKTRNSFNSHIFHKHTKERKHLCKICSRPFKTWTQLKIHVRSHTGERPFTCTQCSYGSTIQGNMRCHLANKHGMEKSQVEESMKKITSKTPEMTPAALEELMAAVLAKIIPDKALKQPKKKKAKPQKEKCDQKERNENKKSSSNTVAKETCAPITSSSVSFQAGKSSTSDLSVLSSPEVSSSSSTSSTSLSSSKAENLRTPVDVSKSRSPRDLQAKPRKQSLKIAPKECNNSLVSQIVSGNQVVVFPPAATTNSSLSSSSSISTQNQAFLQAGASTAPAPMLGYAILPAHLLPSISAPSSLISEGAVDQKQPLLLMSPSGLLSTGNVLESQEGAGLQISDLNTTASQVNIVLNNSTNPSSTQISSLPFPAMTGGAKSFLNAQNPPLVKDDSINNFLPGSLQTQVGPYLLYANPPVTGQQVLLPEANQQGMQSLLISYPGFQGHQVVQGLPELQFVPQTQDGATIAPEELIPVLIEQVMGAAEVGEQGDEIVACPQEGETILSIEPREDDKKEVKTEGQAVSAGSDAQPEGTSVVLMSSNASPIPQGTNTNG